MTSFALRQRLPRTSGLFASFSFQGALCRLCFSAATWFIMPHCFCLVNRLFHSLLARRLLLAAGVFPEATRVSIPWHKQPCQRTFCSFLSAGKFLLPVGIRFVIKETTHRERRNKTMPYCYAVWDIDGTLLRSAKAGLYAFEEAMLLFFQKKASLDTIPTAGRTDWFIARTIFERFGYANASSIERQNFIELYETLLPAHLKARQGLVLPGVKEALSWSQQQPQIKTLLLTGNTRQGALAKLTHYGLKDFFDFDASIFCDFDEERNELSRRLWLNLQTKQTSLTGQQILIIGDTPHDILCGQAIGAHTAAVATGQYTLKDLNDFNPSAVYQQLPEPETLFASLQN